MSCCGGRRSAAQGGAGALGATPRPVGGQGTTAGNPGGGHSASAPGSGLSRTHHAHFRYDGRTGLTAIGGATGTRYRFGHPGAVLAVDPRDRLSLSSVPGLRQVAAG